MQKNMEVLCIMRFSKNPEAHRGIFYPEIHEGNLSTWKYIMVLKVHKGTQRYM